MMSVKLSPDFAAFLRDRRWQTLHRVIVAELVTTPYQNADELCRSCAAERFDVLAALDQLQGAGIVRQVERIVPTEFVADLSGYEYGIQVYSVDDEGNETLLGCADSLVIQEEHRTNWAVVVIGLVIVALAILLWLVWGMMP